MNKQTVIVLTIIVFSFGIAVIVSYLITVISQITSSNIELSNESTIEIKHLMGNTEDPKDDAKLLSLNLGKTAILPQVQDYHDIISTEVQRIYSNNYENDKLLFTIHLDGNPNYNKRYETVYIWLLTSQNEFVNGKDQIYTIIIPNFANDSAFDNEGWYLAVFNNTNNQYSLPLSKLKDMPVDRVEVFIDPFFIGNVLSFNYSTAVMMRVNDTYLTKPPDYLLDSSPDDDSFWIEWFT